MMKSIILSFIILFNGAACAMQSEEFTYLKLNSEKIYLNSSAEDQLVAEIINVNQTNKLISVTFDGISLEYEQVSDKFRYFPAPIHLAIPSNIDTRTKSWTFEESEYDILSKGSIKILGRSYEVLLIKQSPRNCVGNCDKRVFYYSLKKGLLAFSIVNLTDKASDIWLSSDKFGVR